jgi:hypothetical protein
LKIEDVIPNNTLETAKIANESMNPAAPIVIAERAIAIEMNHFQLTLSVSFPKYKPQKATTRGLYWVFRYHFGSIAFGAFLIALV